MLPFIADNYDMIITYGSGWAWCAAIQNVLLETAIYLLRRDATVVGIFTVFLHPPDDIGGVYLQIHIVWYYSTDKCWTGLV